MVDILIWFVAFTAVCVLGVLYYDERDQITRIERRLINMGVQFDRLAAEVAETKTVIDGAIVLLGGLAEEIRNLKNYPNEIEARAEELANALDEAQAQLGSALVAGTE